MQDSIVLKVLNKLQVLLLELKRTGLTMSSVLHITLL